MTATLPTLLKLVGTARDGALLRFSIGSEYLKAGDPSSAAAQLREAVERDPDYSAAWKLLGRALVEAGRAAEAQEAFERGIAVATNRGDQQAAKEMAVYARRLRRTLDDPKAS